MSKNIFKFPDGFMFGTATSAYQVEGAWNEDGKGESIWDRYVHSGTHSIRNDDTADIAIDNYHRYNEDFDILKDLNTNAYRFSISWSRILPDGKGKVNRKGIDFYNNVIDALIARGITPTVTLFHWDLPAALQTLGGWANREIVEWFTDYAKICFENFGDRVKIWYTINEPIVFTKRGYGLGLVPPCWKDCQAGLDAAHNALLAHGKTVELFRKMKIEGQIGLALDVIPKIPASDDPQDVAIAELANATSQMYFYDAIVKGKYPELALKWYGTTKYASPEILPGDMQCISQKLDFIGINYYLTQAVKYKKGNGFYDYEVVSRNYKVSNLFWESDVNGFCDVIEMVEKDLPNVPIVISENGWSVDDKLENGEIHDTERTEYLKAHLEALGKCIRRGAPIKGYFLWSAFDNFEWNCGNSIRFGIVYVDYRTLKRTVKDSGKWYAEFIKDHSATASRRI